MEDKQEQYVTKTGKVLTNEDVQALADEAEEGYTVVKGYWQERNGKRVWVKPYAQNRHRPKAGVTSTV